jgi:hypothetical protein
MAIAAAVDLEDEGRMLSAMLNRVLDSMLLQHGHGGLITFV